jgi:hypothetical protein
MQFDSADERRAYIEGAKAAFESAYVHLDARTCRELEDWINHDLAGWSGGEPPVPPSEWPSQLS